MLLFENDVKVDGTQTCLTGIQISLLFENDVKVDGTQTSFSEYWKSKWV